MLLEIRHLTKKFGGLTAINELDLNVRQGEILGLIGPNGAGKTTLFNLITGFLLPDEGEIKFNGESIVGLKPYKICGRGITRTFQIVKSYLQMEALENVMVGAFSQKNKTEEARKMAIEMLDFAGLSDKSNVLAKNLTIADRKRLDMARALCTNPQLLLLDEVVAGLNPKEVDEALELIAKVRDKRVTLIIVEHVMKAVMSISDRIVVLDRGRKIAEGLPEEVKEDRKVITAYLGTHYA